MLMRTDPFREFDRLAEQVLGTTARPAAMPMDAWREGEDFVFGTGAGQVKGRLTPTGPEIDIQPVADLETATQIAHGDPLHVSGSSTLTVHEWRVRRFP